MKSTRNADSHFVIGKLHIKQNSPCQDHALFGQLDDTLFIVVSDGCSSGRHTDIGARIITCTTIIAIKECLAVTEDLAELPDLIHQEITSRANKIAIEMGLENQDLLATCVYAVITPNGGFVHILGDGHVILKGKNDDLFLINTEWKNNTPYYPADDRKQSFIKEHSKTENGNKSLKIEMINILEDFDTEDEIFLNIQESIKGFILPLSTEDIESLEVIVISSDGISNFKKDGKLLQPLEVAKKLTMFKNWEGEFVKRRLSRGLLDFSKEETFPDDDVALAAIHFTTKEEKI